MQDQPTAAIRSPGREPECAGSRPPVTKSEMTGVVLSCRISVLWNLHDIYGPLITFACHRVLKNGYLTTQFPQVLPSITSLGFT